LRTYRENENGFFCVHVDSFFSVNILNFRGGNMEEVTYDQPVSEVQSTAAIILFVSSFIFIAASSKCGLVSLQ
jgi:hypothetical protein